VRDAAREAVTMLGDNGIWQLRESYENLTGKKPPEDWNWEKLASELFASYDKARLSEVYALMDEGLAAQKSVNLDAMATAFDRVLARAPTFERRREMVPGYVDFARSLERADRPRAITILRKAVRIDPSGPRAKEAESELTYLEALELAGHGVIDETAYRRAVELDPGNARAREALGRIQTTSDAASRSFVRYLIASVLGALACVGLALVWRGRR
jgi:tetratricopeptide (TPR) repeat protein